MTENVIYLMVFLAVIIIAFTILTIVARNREITRNIEAATSSRGADNDIFSSDNEQVSHYFNIQKKNQPDSLEMKLIAAGFLTKGAPRLFHISRIVAVVVVTLVMRFVIVRLFPDINPAGAVLIAAVFGGISFILCSAVLDYYVRKTEIQNRKLFPDFMDMLIVCVDAGLSIEAAIDRVAREFITTKPVFGTHLAIISLEVRAGRPLHEALTNFAYRVRLEEARTLSTLFRQSQELGASVVRTLRTYSKEMRQMRLLRAEEKANALPIKMLFPMAVFLFPVNLIIVIVPIVITVLRLFQGLRPPSI
ncbi:type II secretion system F family protein [Paragemmobacter straminiformis]|uniref:Type II secretion system F family protein n=1 Tax=Paragemmobacter straminiformis TaxID=2045119 RepID=A0A842ID25_9RHOB|nr:type II secretion system F family protein [Gemmobacter straminiformis]MBC2837501.1 type II secretion system F family protein [Gemmobacter straminiformis]